MTQAAARYTFEFVRSVLPKDATHLLEIGCGDGKVAALLKADGYDLTAIDSHEEAVKQARSRGVDARLGQWPDIQCGPVDAVLFTRSLHHIHSLKESVRAALDALRGPGVIIVEDFGYDEASEATLGWFRSLAELLIGIRGYEPSPFVADLLAQPGNLKGRWMAEHDHDLHSATAIGAALAEHGGSFTTASAAYYFRYLAPMFEGDEDGLEALIRHEEQLITLGLIAPLGRRFVVVRA